MGRPCAQGFGLNLVLLRGENTPIGMCGLVKREGLEFPDLGYALLPEFCGKGYASEAAKKVLKYEMSKHTLHTILAITFPDNLRSNLLLENIGFCMKGTVELYGLQNNLYEFQT
ncbi:GNAT family N-acetyltransferase [Marinobacter similis]|uniref:GNAT family N-acetyltransferase n=1 Tax=Marinobacter similis TaxID=1420916 RepID=UPI0038B30777